MSCYNELCYNKAALYNFQKNVFFNKRFDCMVADWFDTIKFNNIIHIKSVRSAGGGGGATFTNIDQF